MRFPQLADNNQILTATADGTLDWGVSFIPDIDNVYVSKDPDHYHYWYSPSSMVAFLFNQETANESNKKAFNDVNFRRAVSMLIDRQSIIDIAGYGYPVINEDPSMLGQFYAAFANPEVAEKFGKYGKFDLEGAKALLDESGYKDADGDGFRDNPDGTPIALDIEIPNGWTDWIDAVQIALESLQAAGLNAKMSTPEESVWASDLIDAKYSVSLNAIASAANPYFPYIRSFNPVDFGKSRTSAQRWTDPEVVEMLNKYTQVKDPAEQKSIMDAIQLKVAEAMPVIPVYNSPSFYQYNTKRFNGWANADNPITSPVVSNANPGRLIQLLALRPVAQ
jgi:peptide/nickel transport system substrate-binding protein